MLFFKKSYRPLSNYTLSTTTAVKPMKIPIYWLPKSAYDPAPIELVTVHTYLESLTPLMTIHVLPTPDEYEYFKVDVVRMKGKLKNCNPVYFSYSLKS